MKTKLLFRGGICDDGQVFMAADIHVDLANNGNLTVKRRGLLGHEGHDVDTTYGGHKDLGCDNVGTVPPSREPIQVNMFGQAGKILSQSPKKITVTNTTRSVLTPTVNAPEAGYVYSKSAAVSLKEKPILVELESNCIEGSASSDDSEANHQREAEVTNIPISSIHTVQVGGNPTHRESS